MKKMNLNYPILFAPALIGYGTYFLCPFDPKDSPLSQTIRPPNWVFSIVWPILYLSIGLAWTQSRTIAKVKSKRMIDYAYLALSILLASWSVVYSCQKNKKNGIFVLVLSIMCTLVAYTTSPLSSKLLMCPLLAWLIYALMLNIIEVNDERIEFLPSE